MAQSLVEINFNLGKMMNNVIWNDALFKWYVISHIFSLRRCLAGLFFFFFFIWVKTTPFGMVKNKLSLRIFIVVTVHLILNLYLQLGFNPCISFDFMSASTWFNPQMLSYFSSRSLISNIAHFFFNFNLNLILLQLSPWSS